MSKSGQKRKDKAVQLVVEHVRPSGRILEVSCGRGAELVRLKELGFEVRGTNFTKYEEALAPSEIDHGVDVMKGLPYEDNAFDGVLLLDVIEHVRDHVSAVAELSRVCKWGGKVIVMTPNVMKIASRIHFLLTGFLKVKRAFIGFDVPLERSFAFHNHPPHLPTFLYQLHAHRLRLLAFTASVYKAKSFLLLAVFWPFIWFSSFLNLTRGERNLRGIPEAKMLLRTLTSAPALCGESWFVVAVKERDTGTERMTPTPQWSEPHKDDEAGNVR